MNGMSLWWWALPVVLLPILWHRQKREQTKTSLLATARFLPTAEPKLQRVWRWHDVVLMLLRCLLLVTLIALQADLVLAWRGDTVLVVPGTPPAVVEKQAAQRITLPDRDAVTWLHAHEREFEPGARLVVVGDAVMPAVLPRFRHAVELSTTPAPVKPAERHVAVFSDRADDWRSLFAAAEGPWHIVVDAAPGPRTELVVWDRPDAPPAGLRGYLWHADGGPPNDADGARAMFAAWQRQHLGAQPYTAPAQALAADPAAPAGPASGALRHWLGLALVVLFALERMVTHVRRR
jgi:hypothetical protein